MKLLFDQNLSRHLVARLSDDFPRQRTRTVAGPRHFVGPGTTLANTATRSSPRTPTFGLLHRPVAAPSRAAGDWCSILMGVGDVERVVLSAVEIASRDCVAIENNRSHIGSVLRKLDTSPSWQPLR